ncbi:hypothetical protein Bca101_030828 [Brassica carinata]
MRWLMQFAGFRERLLADDLFLAKLAMECGVGFFTQTAAEYERRRENFFNKLEVVFADVIIVVITSLKDAVHADEVKSMENRTRPGCPEDMINEYLCHSHYSEL